MKRKTIAILALSILCVSTFSFAGEEDFPIALKITENRSIVFKGIIQEELN